MKSTKKTLASLAPPPLRRRGDSVARGLGPAQRAWMLLLLLLAGGAVMAQTAPATRDDSRRETVKRPAAIRAEAGRTASGPKCSGAASAPERIALAAGKSTLLQLPEAVVNRSTGNPAVVQAMLLSPQSLYVLGLEVGSTNMIVQGKSGTCRIFDIFVGIDPAGLQTTLAQLMPDERQIVVHAAADTLVLSGVVSDAEAAGRAMALAGAFVRRPLGAVYSGLPGNAAQVEPPAALSAANAAGGVARIVNLLSVSAPQQVMLEVKIAEVSKSLLDKLELGLTLRGTGGSWTSTLVTNFLTGNANGIFTLSKSNGNQLTLEAQKDDGLVKILAEPTVMAISGQEGSFLAGGKVLIPVSQDTTSGTTRITLEEKEFGVGLKFTPTVLAGGRINLRVAPEVSELSREGVSVSSSGTSNVAILPLITTRRAATTVQLFDGQSFAIGGLIKNNINSSITGLPLLGEIPILGALFRSTQFQQDKTELLFVVTPRLVRPQPGNISLPTDKVPDPNRADVMLNGRLEGKAAAVQPAGGNATASAPPAAAGGFEMK